MNKEQIANGICELLADQINDNNTTSPRVSVNISGASVYIYNDVNELIMTAFIPKSGGIIRTITLYNFDQAWTDLAAMIGDRPFLRDAFVKAVDVVDELNEQDDE